MHDRAARGARLVVVAAALATFGLSAAAIGARRGDIADAGLGQRLIAGETWSADYLRTAGGGPDRGECGTGRDLQDSIVRLRVVEEDLAAGRVSEVDSALASLSDLVERGLRCSPSQPFLWLERFWLDALTGDFGPKSWRALETSYALGGHESWIALRRSRTAVPLLLAMPDALRRPVMAEFRMLLKDGFVWEATQLVRRAPQPLRNAIGDELLQLPAGARERLNAALVSSGAEPFELGRMAETGAGAR